MVRPALVSVRLPAALSPAWAALLPDARVATFTDAGHLVLDESPAAVAAVQDFDFMGGSLGTAAGEAVIAAMRAALVRKAPFILFAASGGARMQEGILSLMQMAKTSARLSQLHDAGLPYISIMLDPTTGGVTASYAMLGEKVPEENFGKRGRRRVKFYALTDNLRHTCASRRAPR